jgi:hypothetical protein
LAALHRIFSEGYLDPVMVQGAGLRDRVMSFFW